MKLYLVKEAGIAMLMVLSATLFLNYLPLKIEWSNPIQQEFADFDLYDLYYAGNADLQLPIDNEIILVQAADNRPEIAWQLQQLKAFSPAVIGVDVLFTKPHADDPAGDRLLNASLDDPRIVPSYRTTTEQESKALIAPSIISPNLLASRGGYVNFTGDSLAVVRSFYPALRDENKTYLSFALALCRKYAHRDILPVPRQYDLHYINYSGNIRKFLSFTTTQFSAVADSVKAGKFNPFRHKIILVGTFYKGKRIIEDLKFSPLGAGFNGRGYPDMYGVVIHANIIEMLLQQKLLICAPPASVSYLLAALLDFFLLYFIFWLKERLPIRRQRYHHSLVIVVQVVSIIGVIYILLKLFDWFFIRLELFPVVFSLILCLEMVEWYKHLAAWLHRRFRYQSILNNE